MVSWFRSISTARTRVDLPLDVHLLAVLDLHDFCVGPGCRIGFSVSGRASSAMRRAIRLRTCSHARRRLDRTSGDRPLEQLRHQLDEDHWRTNHESIMTPAPTKMMITVVAFFSRRTSARHFAQLVAHVAQELNEPRDPTRGDRSSRSPPVMTSVAITSIPCAPAACCNAAELLPLRPFGCLRLFFVVNSYDFCRRCTP